LEEVDLVVVVLAVGDSEDSEEVDLEVVVGSVAEDLEAAVD
jgi:hypothetical protein